jgi:hypothetical protein
MKGSKSHLRVSSRSTVRRVSLHFRDAQVTAKLRMPVTVTVKPALKSSFR